MKKVLVVCYSRTGTALQLDRELRLDAFAAVLKRARDATAQASAAA